MSGEIDYVESGFKIIVGGALAVGGWLWTTLVSDVKNIQKQVDSADINLLHHKLDAEKSYAGKSDIVVLKQETQETLNRIHTRIDDMGNDIKTIIGKLGDRKH